MSLFLYNTLSRTKEEFKPSFAKATEDKPINKIVGLYTCGPTVYNYAHLGNLRTFVFEDILKRVLRYNGFKVKHVMNITDVGHLTGDRDMGEDKLEAGAKREGKSAWEIAEFYTGAFKKDIAALNIIEPDIWCKATDNIAEQIDLIKQLEAKGYTYQTSDGIYFDTSKFPDYNKLSHLKLDELKEGARVEKNEEKKNPTDFALWKFSTPHPDPQPDEVILAGLLGKEREIKGKRQMEWESPWGVGWPGWHLECSAMSLKYLKDNLDIHCGGIDLINIHHTNEIAQSEAATSKPFFNYWLHGAFLNIVGGKKMAKSEGNFLTLENAITNKSINPVAYRFACLQVHYRKPMEYGEEAMTGAANGLNNLYEEAAKYLPFEYSKKEFKTYTEIPGKYLAQEPAVEEFKNFFLQAINDDLNMPEALSIFWTILRGLYSPRVKASLIVDFDKVLGLEIYHGAKKIKEKQNFIIPDKIKELLTNRETARAGKDWAKSDSLREEIEAEGWFLEDGPGGARLVKK